MSHRKLPEEREPRKGLSLDQILWIIFAVCMAGLLSWILYVFVLGG